MTATQAEIGRGNAYLAPQPRTAAMKIAKFVPHRSGAMVGFLPVETASGLIIDDLKLMVGPAGKF